MTSTMAAMEELGAHGEYDPWSWSLIWRTPKSSVVHKYAIGATGIGRHASTESNRRRRSELRGGEDGCGALCWISLVKIVSWLDKVMAYELPGEVAALQVAVGHVLD